MKRSILVLVAVAGLLLCGCGSKKSTARTGPPKNDVEFGKEVFRLMAEGDESVSDLVDWEHLNMVGVDVGSMYRGVGDKDSARRSFIKGFLGSYSESFKKIGGAERFTNWREQSRDSSDTIVAADAPNGRLMLVTVTHPGGVQYVSKMELR